MKLPFTSPRSPLNQVLILVITLGVLQASSSAANLTGTVTNKTSNKPSGGDDVVLLKLSQGMQEAARTKSDSNGSFSLAVPEDGGQHLVRVTHQGVNYFKPAPVGTTSVQIEVFDAGKRIEGVDGRADVLRVQADSNQMDVTELFVIQNNSKPPRTQMSERSFEFTLPQGTIIDGSLAAGPGGMPVTSAPVPTNEKNHYAYVFPIRPGETKFQISYHVPYSGSFSFQPQLVTGMQDLAVMIPRSMTFKGDTSVFSNGGEDRGMSIFVAHNLSAGKQLAFSISGTGQIPRDAQDGSAGADSQPTDGANGQTAPDNRPGGGMSKPEDTPDPLHAYRWWIIGGLAAALVVGAIVVINQRPAHQMEAPGTVPSAVVRQSQSASSGGRGLLLDAIKEELFQLESERLQGRISDGEYQQAKAALDLTMKRALDRQQVKA